jgi:hypothetical protein
MPAGDTGTGAGASMSREGLSDSGCAFADSAQHAPVRAAQTQIGPARSYIEGKSIAMRDC